MSQDVRHATSAPARRPHSVPPPVRGPLQEEGPIRRMSLISFTSLGAVTCRTHARQALTHAQCTAAAKTGLGGGLAVPLPQGGITPRGREPAAAAAVLGAPAAGPCGAVRAGQHVHPGGGCAGLCAPLLQGAGLPQQHGAIGCGLLQKKWELSPGSCAGQHLHSGRGCVGLQVSLLPGTA